MPPSANGTWDQLFQVTQAALTGAPGADRKKVATSALEPNPDQPRQLFEPAALAELAASIQAHGVLQPLLVRPHPQAAGRYQIVAGERRYQAAKQLGLAELPVVLRELSDGEALELALVENLLREDITPLEEARSLQRLLDAFGYSYAQLGKRLGKNKAFVDHRVRLLKMPEALQVALDRTVVDAETGKLRRPFSPRHAGVVVQLEDEAARVALIEAVFAEGLSVAETGRRKRQLLALGPAPAPALLAAVVGGLSEAEFEALRAPRRPEDAALADTWEDAPVPASASAPARAARSGSTAAASSPVVLAELAVARFFEGANGETADWQALWDALEADRKTLRRLRSASEQI